MPAAAGTDNFHIKYSNNPEQYRTGILFNLFYSMIKNMPGGPDITSRWFPRFY